VFDLSFVDWCVFIGTVCTIGLLLYAALDRHRPRKERSMAETVFEPQRQPRRLFPIALAIIAVLAFGLDAADRHWFSVPE
jgi:hypothetical protein